MCQANIYSTFPNISATVPLGTPGRVRVDVLLSVVLFVVFKGAHSPRPETPCCSLQHPFSSLPFLTTISTKRSQNGSFKTVKNHKNLQKLIIQTHPQSRPAKRLCLEGAEPLKFMTVTHFQLFFQRPRAPKMEPKWEPKWSQP